MSDRTMLAYYQAERDGYAERLAELDDALLLAKEVAQHIHNADSVVFHFRERPAVAAIGAGGLENKTGYTLYILNNLLEEKLRAEIDHCKKWQASAESEIRRYEAKLDG